MSRAFRICGWFFWRPQFHKIRLGRTVVHATYYFTSCSSFYLGQRKRLIKYEACGKSFPQKTNMKRHILTIHEGHKDDKCESGNKSITSNLDLTKHNKATPESHKEYKCESCGKSFSEKGTLKRHIYTIHEGHRRL